MKVSDGLCFIRTSVECLVDLNTQKETAEALGFVYVTFVDDNTLSVYVRRLREKVETNPSHPEHLITIRGFGYQWKEVSI